MAFPHQTHLGRVCRCPVARPPPLHPFQHAPYPLPPVDYDPEKREIRRILRIIAGVLVGIYCMVAVLFSFWAFLQPSPPEFGISSGNLSSFNLTGDELSSTWAFEITAYNPNKVGRVFYYENFRVSIFYGKDYSLSEAHMKPFFQPGKNWTTIQAHAAAGAQYLNDDVKKMMEVDRLRGVVEFGVDVVADISFKTLLLLTTTRWEAAVCNRAKFVLHSEKLSGVLGTLVEARPVSCKTNHQRTAMFFVIWFLIFFLFLLLVIYVFL